MSAHRAESADWLEALNRAVCLEFPNGIREVKNLELNLMSDNGSLADKFEVYDGNSRARHPTSLHQLRESERQR